MHFGRTVCSVLLPVALALAVAGCGSEPSTAPAPGASPATLDATIHTVTSWTGPEAPPTTPFTATTRSVTYDPSTGHVMITATDFGFPGGARLDIEFDWTGPGAYELRGPASGTGRATFASPHLGTFHPTAQHGGWIYVFVLDPEARRIRADFGFGAQDVANAHPDIIVSAGHLDSPLTVLRPAPPLPSIGNEAR